MENNSHINRYNLENFLKSAASSDLTKSERKGIEALARVGDGISIKSGSVLDQISDKRGSAKVLMGRMKKKINAAGVGGIDTMIPRRKGIGKPGALKGDYVLNLSTNTQTIRHSID